MNFSLIILLAVPNTQVQARKHLLDIIVQNIVSFALFHSYPLLRLGFHYGIDDCIYRLLLPWLKFKIGDDLGVLCHCQGLKGLNKINNYINWRPFFNYYLLGSRAMAMGFCFEVMMHLSIAFHIQRNCHIAATVLLIAFSDQKLEFWNVIMSRWSVDGNWPFFEGFL